MNLRKGILPAVLGMAVMTQVGVANAGIIDFESTPTGTYSSLSFNSGEATLTFIGGTGQFDIVDASPGAPISGQAAISYFANPGTSPFQLSFATPTSYVQVGVGDYNGDEDNTYMQAFDALDNLIGSTSYYNPAPTLGGGFLTIAAPNIAYVRFWDDEPFPGAVYWDSITYESRTNPPEVPAPATLGLLLASLLGMRVARRQRQA